MDEAKATDCVKELTSLLVKGSLTYFITITINETETLGVRTIPEAIKENAERDVVNSMSVEELTNAYLPFILRIRERFVSVLCRN